MAVLTNRDPVRDSRAGTALAASYQKQMFVYIVRRGLGNFRRVSRVWHVAVSLFHHSRQVSNGGIGNSAIYDIIKYII